MFKKNQEMRDSRFSVSRFATVLCRCSLIKMLHKNGQIGQGILLKGPRSRDYDSRQHIIHEGTAPMSTFTWEFPKIRGTVLGVLVIRILLFEVLYQCPLFSESPI